MADLSDPRRLTALSGTGVLDEAGSSSLDQLAAHVGDAIGAPVALVSLVDDARQVFAGSRGLDVRSTPLSHSFCRHVVESEAPLVVDDARLDPLVRDNGAVADLGVIAYAGVPLRDAAGNVLGALCAIHPEPRAWAQEDVERLEQYAALVGFDLDAKQLVNEERRRGDRFGAVIDSALDAIVTADATGRIVEYNAAAQAVFGHSRETALGADLSTLLVPPGRRDAHRKGWTRHLETGESRILGRRVELDALRADGTEVPIELTVTRSTFDGEPLFTAFARDLTERRRAAAALHTAEQQLRAVLDTASFALVLLDVTGEVVLTRGTGEAGPRTPEDLRRALDGEDFRTVHEVDGAMIETHFSPFRGADGAMEGVVGISMDVTERHRTQARVAHLAYHDQLTGLWNRTRMDAEIATTLAAARVDGSTAAVLYIDLDDFKTVNDSLGHGAGDLVLREVADRLGSRLGPGRHLSRQGGDEFLLYLTGLGTDPREPAEAAAREVLAAFAAPFAVGGVEFGVTTSVGLSLYPADGEHVGELMRRADAAMYEAKRSGGGFCFSSRAPGAEARRRLTLSTRLRRGLADDEFALHYQPILDLGTGRPRAMEALVRWHDPDSGPRSPADFIPGAEANGSIVELGAWVADAACAQLRAWRDLGLDLLVSVNVSPVQLDRPGLCQMVRAALERHDVEPTRLVLEVTESGPLEDIERGTALLSELRGLGVRIAVDDFGAGYSSLARLRHLPVDKLKLDRSLLDGVDSDPGAAAVIEAALVFSGALGIRAVAEGVETESQLRWLLDRGCPYAQGYFIQRPMPAADATAYLLRTAGRRRAAGRPALSRAT